MKLTISDVTAGIVSGLVEPAKKLQKRSKSKGRHMRYCFCELFETTKEELHDDKVLSLVDSVMESNGLRVGDKHMKEL